MLNTMAPQLSRVERERIIALRQSGLRVIDICRQTGITRKTVYFWIRRFEEEGTLEAHHRQLYQRATTAEQDRAIVAAHLENPFLSTRTTSSTYNISMDTVRRRLKEVGGLKHRRPAKKVEFTQRHKEERYMNPILMGTKPDPKQVASYEKRMRSALEDFDLKWLGKGNKFITGDAITVADLLAACELEQPRMAGFDPKDDYANIAAWWQRVKEHFNPYYEEAHVILNKVVKKYCQTESKL